MYIRSCQKQRKKKLFGPFACLTKPRPFTHKFAQKPFQFVHICLGGEKKEKNVHRKLINPDKNAANYFCGKSCFFFFGAC